VRTDGLRTLLGQTHLGAMTTRTVGDLILFVGGEPDPGIPSIRDSTVRFSTRVLAGIFPIPVAKLAFVGRSTKSPGSASPPSGELPWRLPSEQIHCVNTVVEVAYREGKTVTLVDTAHPAGRRALVDRWVGSDRVLPVLVRSDGALLEGIEKFGARRVRQFIRGVSADT
jgi:hypothetical protein